MRRTIFGACLAIALFSIGAIAQEASTTSPYKVLKTARVGGEGGWDYIYADVGDRRLFIPRNGTREVPATATTPAVPAQPGRISAYNLDTLQLVGEIPNTGGQGVAVCAGTGHGFSSSRPGISMFDIATLKLIKQVDIPQGFGPDGIYCDPFNDHVYVFSHPTKNALVIDAKTGDTVGTVDLAGTPEQAVGDAKGTVYVVMQAESNIAVVDAKTMKTTAHYDFKDKGGRCNGLALDVKNKVLFVACGASSMTPAQGQPAQPTMVVMSATDGKILTTLPLPGGSDGAQFNPGTMEAFATLGNGILTVVKEDGPTSFHVEENLPTMNGARTIALDTKTNHVFTMSQQYGPPPANAPAGGRGPARGAVVPGSFSILMIGK